MPSNDTPESPIAEADRRVERAKASLLARVEALKHKLGDARHQLDIQSQIAKHPLPAIGIAFAVGAVLALGSRRADAHDGGGHTLSRAGLGALTAFGLRVVRELAIGQLGHVAKRWWAENVAPADAASTIPPEADRDLEPFLEH